MKVLLLHGKKQSGKTSAANFICGEVLKKNGVITNYTLTEKGDLVVPANTESGEGILDLQSTNIQNIIYYTKTIWPHVKVYNFADELKRIAISLFGLSWEQCYGEDEQKNTFTNVKWKDFAGVLSSRAIYRLKNEGKYNRRMTGREFLQFFGTEVCRKIYPGCHAKNVINRIREEKPDLAIIADLRFYKDELDIVSAEKGFKVKAVKFTKKVEENEEHSSEASIKDKYMDIVIDNADLKRSEKELILKNYLKECGWL